MPSAVASEFADLPSLAVHLRTVLEREKHVLIFAFNATGKTRLSGAFRDLGKRPVNEQDEDATETRDTLYFNAFTEDLFAWDNDLGRRHRPTPAGSTSTPRFLQRARPSCRSRSGSIAELPLPVRGLRLSTSTTTRWRVTFRKGRGGAASRSPAGEENIFIWCVFVAICERVIDGDPVVSRGSSTSYVDDPISSLDDDNAIAGRVRPRRRCSRRAADPSAYRRTSRTRSAPIFSSHHALFFNVICNELSRRREGQNKVKVKRYFLHRPDAEGRYTLRATGDTPHFQHVATLAELRARSDSGDLCTYHFNVLRSVLEKVASFFGHDDLKICLQGLKDEVIYNRALNLLSHGKYAVSEPVEMGEDNKDLFRRILNDVIDRFGFALPVIESSSAVTAPSE